MRLKTWLVAALGLGSLVALIALSMLASSRKAQEIYTQIDQLNTHHRNVEAKLRALRSDVHLSSIFVRDYLLDVERDHAPEYRDQLAEFRRTNVATLTELRPLVKRDEQIMGLQLKLDEYLGDVRSVVRLDPQRENSPERGLSEARGGAAPERGAGHRPGDRRAERHEPGRATCGGRPAARRTCEWSRSLALADCATWPGGRAGRRLSAAVSRAAIRRGRAPDARTVAATGQHPGRGAKEPVTRAPRSRGAGAHRAEDGTRAAGTDDGTVQ